MQVTIVHVAVNPDHVDDFIEASRLNHEASVNEAGNQDPILATIGSQSATEGANLNFGVSAADPDSTTPTLTTSTLIMLPRKVRVSRGLPKVMTARLHETAQHNRIELGAATFFSCLL